MAFSLSTWVSTAYTQNFQVSNIAQNSAALDTIVIKANYTRGVNLLQFNEIARAAQKIIQDELGLKLIFHSNRELSTNGLPATGWQHVIADQVEFATVVLVLATSADPVCNDRLDGYTPEIGGVKRQTGGKILVCQQTEAAESLKVLLHELGHALGAGHNQQGIMHYTGEHSGPAYFAPDSRAQIKNYLGMLESSGAATQSYNFYASDKWRSANPLILAASHN